jgi:hypothetical protein
MFACVMTCAIRWSTRNVCKLVCETFLLLILYCNILSHCVDPSAYILGWCSLIFSLLWTRSTCFGLIGHLQIYELALQGNCYYRGLFLKLICAEAMHVFCVCAFPGWVLFFRCVAVLDMFVLSGAEAHCLVIGHRDVHLKIANYAETCNVHIQ